MLILRRQKCLRWMISLCYCDFLSTLMTTLHKSKSCKILSSSVFCVIRIWTLPLLHICPLWINWEKIWILHTLKTPAKREAIVALKHNNITANQTRVNFSLRKNASAVNQSTYSNSTLLVMKCFKISLFAIPNPPKLLHCQTLISIGKRHMLMCYWIH